MCDPQRRRRGTLASMVHCQRTRPALPHGRRLRQDRHRQYRGTIFHRRQTQGEETGRLTLCEETWSGKAAGREVLLSIKFAINNQ